MTFREYQKVCQELFGAGFAEIGPVLCGGITCPAIIVQRAYEDEDCHGHKLEHFTVSINREILDKLAREEKK